MLSICCLTEEEEDKLTGPHVPTFSSSPARFANRNGPGLRYRSRQPLSWAPPVLAPLGISHGCGDSPDRPLAMPHSKAKKAPRGEKAQRHTRTSTAHDKARKASSTALPTKAATSTASQGIVPTPSCDPGTTTKADATRDDRAETGAMVTGSRASGNIAGDNRGPRPLDPDLLGPQSSTETDHPREGATHSPHAVAERASVSHYTTNSNVAGGVQNATDSDGRTSPTRTTRSRDRSTWPEMATTTTVGETAKLTHDFESPRSAASPHDFKSPQTGMSPLGVMSPDPMVISGEVSPNVFIRVGVLTGDSEQKGLRDDSSAAPLPIPVAVAQEAVPAVLPDSHEGYIPTAETAAALPSEGKQGVFKGNTVKQPASRTSRSARSRASLLKSPLSPELDQSFYNEIALMSRSPKTTTEKRSAIDGPAPFWLALACSTFVIALFAALIIARHQSITTAEICVTEDCLVHARLLRDIINTSVDPCHDFWAYVCSRWVPKQTELRENIHSVMDSLRYSWYTQFGGTMRQSLLKLPVGKKPLAMYEMCVSDSSSSAKNAPKMPLFFQFLDNLPPNLKDVSSAHVSSFSLAVFLAYKWQAPFWISVSVLGGHRSSGGKRRVVVRPGPYAPTFLDHHRVVAASYIQYMKSFFTAFFPKAKKSKGNTLTDAQVAEIRDIEWDVLEQLNFAFAQPKQPAQLTFGDLNTTVANNRTAFSGGWLRSFDEGLALQPRLTRDDEILLSHAPLLDILDRLVVKYGHDKLKILLLWEMVQLFSPLGNLSLLVARYGSKTKADLHRPIYCAHHVEAAFKVLVLSLTVATRFTAEVRQHIDAHFDRLVSTAVEKANGSTWLDEVSRARLVNKLEHVKKRMWPPESLLAEDALEKLYAAVSENETTVVQFWLKAHKVLADDNASADFQEALRLLGNNLPLYIDYDYMFNVVNVATAVATPPSYYSNGTLSMFYGGLGFLMAMELVKSINEEGLRWTAAQSVVNSILPYGSRSAYNDRVRCLGVTHTKNAFPEIPALEIAYSALEESRLPGEPGHRALSSELPAGKVFFFTICYMTCTVPGYPDRKAADCNKLARNSDYFARVYDCQKGTKMNPEKKCSFFG
ncbi:hypothetical protein HPB50_009829 [Hyalomma asiaticum]|uniref:Uncharacterized protein n=1 Tax=Hyalomma asiaticum TaxID=266040 RepID=A0ACB7RSU7_HYAAI|nr:hypothetical protein HPB50_009829 [Hyalomma asiaticum]